MKNLTLSAAFTAKASAEDSDTLVITGMANTIAKDRAGDIILASAWETSGALMNYMKNPIVLAFHDHSKPIGKMISVTPTSMGLQVEAEISKAAGPIYDLIKDRVLRTFSVGFSCKDADYDQDTGIFIIKDLELHEVSVVSVPCNQDSTFQVAKSLNALDYDEFKNSIKSLHKRQPKQELSLIEKLAIELGIKENI